jgi:hypothetical protein
LIHLWGHKKPGISAIVVDIAAIPCQTSLTKSLGLRYAMSRHCYHFGSHTRTFEQFFFLIDAGKLEAGL